MLLLKTIPNYSCIVLVIAITIQNTLTLLIHLILTNPRKLSVIVILQTMKLSNMKLINLPTITQLVSSSPIVRLDEWAQTLDF